MTAVAAGETSTEQTSDERPRNPRNLPVLWGVRLLRTVLGAAIVGVLLQARGGYRAGTGDQWVLSLKGISWSDPTAFVNDWFNNAAPQPHWLFDIVTWAGAAAGHLGAVYFAYWVLSLLVFGLGTALLAEAWAPRAATAATIGVSLLLPLIMVEMLGTTNPALGIALPNGLGGFLAYLTLVCVITRRDRAAFVAATAASLVHVQLGAITGVILLLTVVALRLRGGRWHLWLLGGFVVSLALTIFGLKLRPVAGTSADFVQVCQVVIPYHCAASTWQVGRLVSGFAFVALALLSVLYYRRADLRVWAAGTGIPAAGLVAAVLLDRLHVPVLGVWVQVTNAYRVGVLLAPFAVWGALAPLLAPSRRLQILTVPVAAVCTVLVLIATVDDGAFSHRPGIAVAGAAGVAVFALAAIWPRLRQTRWLPALGVGALAGVLLVGGFATRQLTLQAVNISFEPGAPVVRVLGARIQTLVPPGQVILVPPWDEWARLATRRAVVVDCKAVPYGGPAWRDYLLRINSLGGYRTCVQHRYFYTVPAAQMEAAARQFGARYMLLYGRDPRRGVFEADGWVVLLPSTRATGSVILLEAPPAPPVGG